MYPKFIELHDASTGGEQFVNVGNIEGVFTEMVSEGIFVTHIDLTDGDCYQVRESYNELKQLIHDCGCLIHKADPRIDTTKRLTTKDLEKMIGEPVWNSNTWKWELVWECSADGTVTTRDCGADYEYNEDDLIKTPLYSMKGETHEQ